MAPLIEHTILYRWMIFSAVILAQHNKTTPINEIEIPKTNLLLFVAVVCRIGNHHIVLLDKCKLSLLLLFCIFSANLLPASCLHIIMQKLCAWRKYSKIVHFYLSISTFCSNYYTNKWATAERVRTDWHIYF